MSTSTPNLVVAPTIPQTPLFDSNTGQLSWAWVKWFQNITQAVNSGLTLLGQFIGELSQSTQITGRAGTVGSITQNIDAAGVVEGPGIDFIRPYLNKNTDNIADGTGSPLTGGKTAYTALVASGPISGRSLIFNGAQWQPAQVQYGNVNGTPVIPANEPTVTNQWIDSYDASTGLFTRSQPAFSSISGQISIAQLPAAGFSGTVPLAKITVGGADGSLTVTNGLITAVVNPT